MTYKTFTGVPSSVPNNGSRSMRNSNFMGDLGLLSYNRSLKLLKPGFNSAMYRKDIPLSNKIISSITPYRGFSSFSIYNRNVLTLSMTDTTSGAVPSPGIIVPVENFPSVDRAGLADIKEKANKLSEFTGKFRSEKCSTAAESKTNRVHNGTLFLNYIRTNLKVEFGDAASEEILKTLEFNPNKEDETIQLLEVLPKLFKRNESTLFYEACLYKMNATRDLQQRGLESWGVKPNEFESVKNSLELASKLQSAGTSVMTSKNYIENTSVKQKAFDLKKLNEHVLAHSAPLVQIMKISTADIPLWWRPNEILEFEKNPGSEVSKRKMKIALLDLKRALLNEYRGTAPFKLYEPSDADKLYDIHDKIRSLRKK